jgi:hypothetical protein
MAKKTSSRSVRLLFIGNSFTQRNNLPTLVVEMAAERGVSVSHELISAGGASLRTHWNAGRAATAIDSVGFDYVVLQEQSTLPAKNAKRMAENVRLFEEAIHQAGSKTVLYMTWARKNAPETQQAITDAYTTIAEETGAILVPVGLAWQSFFPSSTLVCFTIAITATRLWPVRIWLPACSWLYFYTSAQSELRLGPLDSIGMR